MRKVNEHSLFYSRGKWWQGHKIVYTEIDEWVGLKDRNGRHIYEWDILEYKIDPEGVNEKAVMLWQEKEKEFGLLDITHHIFIPIEVNGIYMFNPGQLKVVSALYQEHELRRELKL